VAEGTAVSVGVGELREPPPTVVGSVDFEHDAYRKGRPRSSINNVFLGPAGVEHDAGTFMDHLSFPTVLEHSAALLFVLSGARIKKARNEPCFMVFVGFILSIPSGISVPERIKMKG